MPSEATVSREVSTTFSEHFAEVLRTADCQTLCRVVRTNLCKAVYAARSIAAFAAGCAVRAVTGFQAGIQFGLQSMSKAMHTHMLTSCDRSVTAATEMVSRVALRDAMSAPVHEVGRIPSSEYQLIAFNQHVRAAGPSDSYLPFLWYL